MIDLLESFLDFPVLHGIELVLWSLFRGERLAYVGFLPAMSDQDRLLNRALSDVIQLVMRRVG